MHLEVPALMCLYASVLRREGRNEEALQVYAQAVDISKELYGQSVITATSLNNMAFLAFHMELKQQARSLFMDALTVLVHVHGPTDPHLVPVLNNIGRVEESLGDLNAAQGLYTRAMAITAAASAPSHSPSPSTTQSLTSPLSPRTGSAPATHQHLYLLWLQKRAGSGFVVIRVRAINLTKPRSQPSFQVEFGSTKLFPKGHSILIGASRISHKEEFFPSSVDQAMEFRDMHTASTPVVFSMFEHRPLSGQKLVCTCSCPLQQYAVLSLPALTKCNILCMYFANEACVGSSTSLSLNSHWFDMQKPSGNIASASPPPLMPPPANSSPPPLPPPPAAATFL